MDRDSIIYKGRRKLQSFAFKIIPHDILSGIYYRICLHEKLNLHRPENFNEKLQWYKLYYCPNHPLIPLCTDKYQVREYVESKGYKSSLTKLINVWDNADDIDESTLPDQFVLKCTHGCAYNIICKNKADLNMDLAKKQLRKWLKEDFASFNVELHYGKIKEKRIICEEYLGEAITDYKFFCFNGQPAFFYISSDLVHDRQAKMGFFDMEHKKIPLIRNDYKDIGEVAIPSCFNEMVEVAKTLSQDFPFVRVDLLMVGSSYRFSELTFTPSAGMMPINPPKYNTEWGKLFDLTPLISEFQNRRN